MPRRRLTDLTKNTVRQLRREQTLAEKMLWLQLRDRKLLGYKFLRQHPILFNYLGKQRFLVADFYCAAKRLVVELDGGIHTTQRDYDTVRELADLRIIRFNNEEVLSEIVKVLTAISAALD
jgi:very-short-patch-repair endonuclease